MASDSLNPPRGLMAMPDEILLEICKRLCSHCSDIPITPKKDLSTQGLLSLSMTSKRLGAIVQQVLFHNARPNNIRKFLQRITERPDLAAQVRRFHNSDGDYWGLENEAHNYVDSSNDEFQLAIKILHDRISSHYRLLETTLAKLTNAKRLKINLPFYEGFEFKDSFKVSTSVSMESVTRLSLKPWDRFDLGQMGGFLAMMPCLERLKVIDCAKVTQKLPLASLRSLTFHYSDHSDGHMEENSLQNIVDSCPKLEHLDLGFTWRMEGSGAAAGSEPLTWSQAQRILHPRRETLKHLKLEFNKTPWGFTSPRPVRQEEYLSSFREFNALESLWVRTVGFGSKDNLGKAPTFPENVQHLVGMLPESLTRICFCGAHPEWDGLLVLAKAIGEGHLPKLKKVMVQDLPDVESDQSGYEELSTALGACVEILDDMEVEVDDNWKQYTTAAYQ